MVLARTEKAVEDVCHVLLLCPTYSLQRELFVDDVRCLSLGHIDLEAKNPDLTDHQRMRWMMTDETTRPRSKEE